MVDKLNLSRQELLLRQETMERTTFLIVGAGAIGSNVAYLLSAMGAGEGNIHLYDHDKVAEENIAPARFKRGQIGTEKVFAVRDGIEEELGVHTVIPYPMKFEDDGGEYDIVIVCPDSMGVRRDAWFNEDLKWGWWIDGRMGGARAEVYVIGPGRDGPGHKLYKTTIEFSDSQLECGEKATAPICKGLLPGWIGAAVANIVNGGRPQPSILYDMSENVIIWPEQDLQEGGDEHDQEG
jgi:molybdopterin/thiamine biosynthesis adenylyltransferase